jgi:hypothetical protein
MPNYTIRNKNKTVKKVGGGLFDKDTSTGIIIKKTKKSENSLIKSYQDYIKNATKYFESYAEHLDNLKELDTFIPNVKSFAKLFTETIIPNDIVPNEKIDKALALLINNYDIDSQSTPRDITMEHIKQQINYYLSTRFQPHERRLIRDTYITLNDDPREKIALKISLINDRITERKLRHTEYLLNVDDLMLMLGDVIEMAKENVVGPEKVSPALARPSRLPLRQMMEEEEKVVGLDSKKELTSGERLNNKRNETENNIRKEQQIALDNILSMGDIEGLPEINEDDLDNDETAWNKVQNKKKSKKSTSKTRTKSKRKTKKSY